MSSNGQATLGNVDDRRPCDYCGARRIGVVEVTMDWSDGRAQLQMCTGCREILAGGGA